MCLNKYKCLHCAQPAPPPPPLRILQIHWLFRPPLRLLWPLTASTATLEISACTSAPHGPSRASMHATRQFTMAALCKVLFPCAVASSTLRDCTEATGPSQKIALGGCDPKHTFTSNIIVVVPCCLSFVCCFLILLGILRNLEDSSESVCAIHCCCGE